MKTTKPSGDNRRGARDSDLEVNVDKREMAPLNVPHAGMVAETAREDARLLATLAAGFAAGGDTASRATSEAVNAFRALYGREPMCEVNVASVQTRSGR